MTGELDIVVDNSDGFGAPPLVCDIRRRTLFIDFRLVAEGYELEVQGDTVVPDGGDRCVGVLEATREEILDWVDELHAVWNRALIRYHDAEAWQQNRYPEYPFAQQVDLRGVDPGDRERLWRELARAGYELYKQLFHGQDDSLKWIGDRLAAALRDDQQVIGVYWDDVVVPWPMLYVPPDPADVLDGSKKVDRAGFWGFRHLVEHRFLRAARNKSHTWYERRPQASAYTNPHIKSDGAPAAAQALRILDRRTTLTAFTRSTELAADFQGPARRHHLLYFSCHCVVGERSKAALDLGDQEPVTAARFDQFLRARPLATNPLVFINACEAIRIGDWTHHFGHSLLRRGANCLVGPFVSIPVPFARRFAAALLCRVLRPGRTVGQAVRALAEHFVHRYDNPLGLTYCVFHGLDSHLCEEVPDAVVAAG